MDVTTAINERRAYRSLEPVEVSDDLIRDLTRHAQLAPTCFNNQPARFVFVRDRTILRELESAYRRGNEWCRAGSMVIAVCAARESDCIINGSEYYRFDTGIQTAFLILRATEIGLVAHPIAGFDPERVRVLLNIPAEQEIVTLIIVGRHAGSMSPLLNDRQAALERSRPERLPIEQVAFIDRFGSRAVDQY
ncbi:MAG: nitroreductase family protein [candidate division WOR-3 bacterium]